MWLYGFFTALSEPIAPTVEPNTICDLHAHHKQTIKPLVGPPVSRRRYSSCIVTPFFRRTLQ
jgi:hypothetical protein